VVSPFRDPEIDVRHGCQRPARVTAYFQYHSTVYESLYGRTNELVAMATGVDQQEYVDTFEQFYREYYREEIGDLARGYPSEQKSLVIDYDDLYRFDRELAEQYLEQPEQLQRSAEEALRLYDLPVDVTLGQAHVRLRGLPSSTDIRAIRASDVNTLVSVRGIVRKATDVRPKCTEAAFRCIRCETLTRVAQEGGQFQEPHQCRSCERQGPFRLNEDQSSFVDAQRIRVQESPEGLRGGETPQAIDVNIEDDVTGDVTPGDHVVVTGILRLDQDGENDSAIFDVYLEGVSVEVEEEQFEDMDITEEDTERILELSQRDDVYEQMIGAIAPTIHGYDEEKLAMTLQLFSGVTKNLPDESRIRGDLHILLIGDPGTGKCVSGETRVTLGDGTEYPIREIVEANLDDPEPVDDGVYDTVDFDVPSMAPDGSMVRRRATKVWKREAPDRMYRIRTAAGRELDVTPSHPLFVQSDNRPTARRADDLTTGDFVAVPSALPTASRDRLEVDVRRSRANNAVRFDVPDEWTPSLARLVGYVIAEGWVTRNEDNSGHLIVTNEDTEILEDVLDAFDRLGLPCTERAGRDGKQAREVHCTASEFVSFLEQLEPAILERSAEQRVPNTLNRACPEIQRAFLRAYIDSEGTVSGKQRTVSVASMSRELLADVQQLLVGFGINSQLRSRKNGSYRLAIGGEDVDRYCDEIGFVTDRKRSSATEFTGTPANTNTNVVPVDPDQLRQIRTELGLSQFECSVPRTTYQHYERGDRNPSFESLDQVVATFERRIEWLEDARRRVESDDWDAIESVRDELDLSQADLADAMSDEQTAVSYYERNDVVPDGGRVADASQLVLDRIDSALSVRDDVVQLRSLVEADVAWDRIESIEPVEPAEEWVYDLEVEGTHSYLSGGVVSHNSQLLQYVRNIAPRSVYTSGKGSSSAGLTAAAVRDDFGDGQQWTLEAGALVLADQGIAAVDELDKMEANDRSAMHEALEQQSISISKAGINATLKSRCSLLGAANPKYGRFDQYEPMGEQIDLEPALISRFDVIFTVTDQPDPEADRELAEHILEANYAGQLNTQREQMAAPDVTLEEVQTAQETVEPTIDPELLRKYVAYAQQNCYPRMSDEARETIQEFYVDLRSKGADEDAPVPVTARKLEALVRLAEASARVRLADEVAQEDAERVVKIVRTSLQDIGVDPETGQFDADVIETGTSKSQRDRIKNLKALIDDLADEYEEGVPVDAVYDRADEIGIGAEKAERELEKLKQKGEVYEPKTDHVRTT
jgi:replicative DNA helicase Mcm